ncbi:hypothetical protein G9A89_006920 [Geosiphon pyriformis]|nr:hypothetical protein G9A89_006920 [Geosiphon pyriformis]
MARNQEIRVDFSQVAGRDQTKEILANNEIELFLMATDDVGAVMKEFDKNIATKKKQQELIYPMIRTQKIIEQRKTWETKLVGLPQNCTAHYLNTTLDQIKAQSCFILRTSKNYTRIDCAYIKFNSKASHNNTTKKPLVIGDTLVHWILLMLKSATSVTRKKKEIPKNIRLAKLYVKRNIPEENIKAFGERSYANMAALRLSHNWNNTNPNNTQKPGSQVNNREEQSKKRVNQPWKSEINKLKQQLLPNLEKGKKVIVIQQLSNTSEKKKVVEIGLPNQSTTLKSTPAKKKETYNPELEINKIKKTLEPILKLLKQMICSTLDSNIEQNYSNNDTWKIGTVNVRGLNNLGKAEEVLCWIIEEQFDFVIVTETKITPTKKKGVFFGSNEYHAFWKSSTEKQIGTGVGILVKKCWIHHVETIKEFHERLLYLGLKFRGRVSVYIIGLYMPASKLPTERAVAKEIRKLLGDIVQNKEIIIVVGNLNEDLLSKSLEETYATNKAKVCPTVATLQHMNLIDTYGAYATNNSKKTWASNGIQRKLNYVFTNAVTASLVTNIGVIDVNESFSTDYKAVVTIIQSDRILAGTKKSRSGRKKCSTTMIDVKKASGIQ